MTDQVIVFQDDSFELWYRYYDPLTIYASLEIWKYCYPWNNLTNACYYKPAGFIFYHQIQGKYVTADPENPVFLGNEDESCQRLCDNLDRVFLHG